MEVRPGAREVAREQIGETRGGNNSFSIEIEEDKESRHIANVLKSLDDALKDEEASAKEQANTPMIPRVPTHLRDYENFKTYFVPKFVSIGPYHHGSLDVRVTEKIKLKFAARFIKEHLKVGKEEVYRKIKERIKDLRKCYEPDATQSYGDYELARMFLIDGCTVLHFIYSQAMPNSCEILKLKPLEIDGFATDLFLLENQVPLIVLNLLIGKSETPVVLQESIQECIDQYSFLPETNQKLESLEKQNHLLDLARLAATTPARTKEKSSSFRRILEKSTQYIGTLLDLPKHLIAVLFDNLSQGQILDLSSFQKIAELKEAGIRLKPNDTGHWTMKDISFSHGTLMLPMIVLDEHSISKLLNFVAYEMNIENCSTMVSAYIYFLSELIARTQDVEELRRNKILYNNLDSNEEVVKLFKGMNKDYVYQSLGVEVVRIACTFDEIEKHCKKKRHLWMAQLYSRYFDSPWSAIALVGAIIALTVTIIQTVYTVLSYYRI